MAKHRESAGSSKRGEPHLRIEPTARTSAAQRAAIARARRFGIRSPYLALLLRAVRDGVVHDWTSLTAFQVQHKLELVKWGSGYVGEPPAVADLLDQLQAGDLVTVEGIDFTRDIRVRRDNFTKAPPGRIVYDPNRCDPNHRLDSVAAGVFPEPDPGQDYSDVFVIMPFKKFEARGCDPCVNRIGGMRPTTR
jgi:hypothetical protein